MSYWLHALERDPRVAFVEANQVVSIFDHVTPNGILRANADVSNTNYSVDADIAIIDTGSTPALDLIIPI